ncbi:hypothetical protein MLD38_038195 [Melastoma candidum]|uniref:Uncharacterized protein n=1 Tax=Melastoma candidum TaxID=119954 RepID=A0ACB9KZB3_9MYRT|nr:hypothetical protein MLD38_038195 [Melastoma candidum]
MSSLLIDQPGGFFSKLLSREASSANSSSRLLYYGSTPRSIAFLWETCPGTPKHEPITTSPYLPRPFLAPPPHYFPCSGNGFEVRVQRGPGFLSGLASKFGRKRSVLSRTCSVSSSKSSSSSPPSLWMSLVPSYQPSTRKSKWFRGRCVPFLCSRFNCGGRDDSMMQWDER